MASHHCHLSKPPTQPLSLSIYTLISLANLLSLMEGFASSFSATLLLLLLLLAVIACQLPDLEAAGGSRKPAWDPLIRRPVDQDESPEDETPGTRWAVLVAGSKGYGNYRHQADVCHAYQILKKGGLKDENIVVFMYDDIADNPLNPRKGIIINHPNGSDVYAGVPKDYTGDQVTAANLRAVLLGDKEGVKGGSGKVVDSKADDRIFIYYTDHGGPGVLGMPNLPHLYADDFIEVLKKMHSAGTYKEMVIYVEACESGSFFEGIMPEDLNIYVTTASNAEESSWGTYCPGSELESAPSEYITCLGDLYSVAWMEDSESHNLKNETIEQQYEKVKLRTSNNNDFESGSHVMEYGSKDIKPEKLYLYQGFDPASINFPGNQISLKPKGVVNQRDADLLFMWERYKRMGDNAASKAKLLKEITDIMLHRQHLDTNIDNIGVHLFGPENGPNILKSVRMPGLALVDDWQCLKSMVRVFEAHCGLLGQYGMKHMRAFANICNNNISQAAMEEASKNTCSQMKTVQYTHPNQVYSA